jgi:putative ABC transport system permease protein
MVSVGKITKSRIKYNKSRTWLTAIAIMLTAVLLAGLGTSAIGLVDMQKQQAAAESNIHATFNNLNDKQVEILKNHMDLEAAKANCIFANIQSDEINGYLTCSQELKSGIKTGLGNIIEGHLPETKYEIAGPAVFFEKMGVKPEIGNKISIDFRVNGEGQIITKEFTICGITSSVDTSKLEGISEDRIVYGAIVSQGLVDELLPKSEQLSSVQLRVKGEDSLNYDQITSKINEMAADIGCSENSINLNKEYLYTMTDPNKEMIGIVTGLALLIIFFAGMVIYSIYYVGVITDVQEIGKLKALGATAKQIKRMLLLEGLTVSVFSVPIGVIIGYLVPYFAFPPIMDKLANVSVTMFEITEYHMFSLPVLLGVVVIVLVTVYISLLKPMRMAAKISPVEAIRYQESSGSKKMRKGNKEVNLFRLGTANLVRNKKRTVVTMTTMALSCVLFMSLAGVMNSMDPEDIARRNIDQGDFKLCLDYSANDEEYPENNLDSLQKQDIFNDEFLNSIRNIDGVTEIKTAETVLISSDFASEIFENGNRVTMSYFDEDDIESYKKEVKQGDLDYGKLIEENGAIFTSDTFMEEYNFKIGDQLSLVIYDGDRKIPLNITISASIDAGGSDSFLIPKQVWDSLDLQTNTISDLFITVNQEQYDSIKASLQSIADSNDRFQLYSMDEEMKLGSMSVNIIKYPLYVILIMIAVIGFMNLINTMITGIVTRKRELGILQAIGLSDSQLSRMLTGEGLVFTFGTLVASFTLGNILGYLMFLWGKESHFMSVSAYHYPIWETCGLFILLLAGQIFVTYFINKKVHQESLIDRIRSGE